jgi:hypothetical protein
MKNRRSEKEYTLARRRPSMKNRRSEQQDKLTRLRESGQTDTQILEWILSNFMSADDVCDVMDSLLEELGIVRRSFSFTYDDLRTAFKEGGENIEYNDDHGYSSTETFEQWFEKWFDS